MELLIPVVELGGRGSQKSVCRVRRARFSSSPVSLPGDPGKSSSYYLCFTDEERVRGTK